MFPEESYEYYCEIVYGEDFQYRYEYKIINLRSCVSITENGTLIEYFFTETKRDKLCKEKFWKINDCPDLK